MATIPKDRPVPLPQLPRGTAKARHGASCGSVKKSGRGKWRAAVLIGLHVAIGAHFLHWYFAGRTITPLEPSEAMQTLELGLVNAGFVLFAAAILATLVFGRFFCGWGCHIIALQDLCTWLLRRVGMKPKPFRSRLLVYVPLGAALYMFVWPQFYRIAFTDRSLPELEPHFTTEHLWATFPGLVISILTLLVVGFLVVYLLGNKGFCTYGCPYGGFFAPADLVAPGKIRVTSACEGCGHCTAVCTSNVRVHEEVRVHGMVVDPGCMKCMDCVDVCPNDALYFGFGRPTAAAGKPREPRRPRSYDFSWPEELSLAAVFMLCVYAFRSLYDQIPLLLSFGLASIFAFLFIAAARMFYIPSVRVHRFQLRLAGRVTGVGRVYLICTAVAAALIVHSFYVQTELRLGYWRMEQAERLYVLPGGVDNPETERLANMARSHLERAHRFGLIAMPNLDSRMGAIYSFLGDMPRAEAHLLRAIALNDKHDAARNTLAKVYRATNRPADAAAQWAEVLKIKPDSRGAAGDLVATLLSLGRREEALRAMQAALRDSQQFPSRIAYARMVAELGDIEGGLAAARETLAANPRSSEANMALGVIEAATGQVESSVQHLKTAVALKPDALEPRLALGQLALSAGQSELAFETLDAARARSPLHPTTLHLWVIAVMTTNRTAAEIQAAEALPMSDVAAAYRLAFLYAANGDRAASQRNYERARSMRSDLPAPP